MMTFAQVAAHFGVKICPAIGHEGCIVSPVDHQRGGVWPSDRSLVHWSPRRMTRLGLRNFLKVVARTRLLNYYAMNKAMRIYAENAWAAKAAAEIHLRLSRSSSANDRLLVLWYASRGHVITPAAQRWAKRRTLG
jgi:hypothetical protein